jgi:hypothetical protein
MNSPLTNLEQLLDLIAGSANTQERVTLASVLESIGSRSFGPAIAADWCYSDLSFKRNPWPAINHGNADYPGDGSNAVAQKAFLVASVDVATIHQTTSTGEDDRMVATISLLY